MKTVVFLLVTLKIASGFFNSELPKIQEIWNESLKIPYRRIYGGMPADENQFPFMVVLVHYKPKHNIEKCGCSLLKTDLVLTAAHCTVGHSPEKSIVVGGQADYSSYFEMRLEFPARAKVNFPKYNMEERWPSEFITHPDYQSGEIFHDIALVRLQEPFTSPNITTIPLSTEKLKRPIICTILGWGLREKNGSTNILHYANAIAKPSDMGCDYASKGPVLCLEKGNIGVCFGDSGSPLVCNGKVWGVAASMNPTGEGRCDAAKNYYAEIHPVLQWLKNSSSGESSVVAASKNTVFSLIFVYFFYLRNSLYTYKI